MSKINLKNLILIAILSIVLISSNIGGLYIYSLDEAKNSVAAREMLETENWIVPTFNGQLRTDKPPLHYYFMMVSYSLFGINESSARFFSVVMGVLTILTTWWLACRYMGPRIGLYASIILLASLHFIIQFHMAVPDPYLIFLMTFGFVAFYVFYRERKKSYLFLSYISFGLGSMAKGPVAIVLPGLSLFLFLLIEGNLRWNYIKKLRPLWILLVFLFIVLPWYFLVGIKTHGIWLREFFLYHNINRYTNTMEGHGAFFLVTPVMVLIGMLPFSIFTVQASLKAWKERKKNNLLLYCLAIAVTIILFFAFSRTKLPNYTVPAYPFLAVVTAWFISNLLDSFSAKKNRVVIPLIFYCLLIIALPFLLYLGLKNEPVLSSLKNLSWYFSILPLGGIISLFFVKNNHFKAMIATLAGSWAITALLFFYVIYPQVDKKNPVARILPMMDRNLSVASYKIYNPAFSFYIRKTFTPIESKNALETYIKDGNQGYIITRKAFSDEINDIKKLKKIAEAKDIFEIPTTTVFLIVD